VTVRLLAGDELDSALRQIGDERYHHRHPFHHLMRDGKLTRGQIQAWALNRYYYQARIPAKDAYLVARLPTPALRREWRRRIIDHDGESEETGGIARWLKLTDGLGLDRDYVISTKGPPVLRSTPMSISSATARCSKRSRRASPRCSRPKLSPSASTAC
jgi:pyrroloquinoline-quinone synthase